MSSYRETSLLPHDPPESTASPEDDDNNNNNSTDSFSTSYFTYPVNQVVSGILRRLTTDSNSSPSPRDASTTMNPPSSGSSTLYTPHRTASPFQPPPLTPLTLLTSPNEDPNDPSSTSSSNSNLQHQHLTKTLAEEIRLLVPPRLQLADTWRLAYSLDRDGASLGTLYENCARISSRSLRAGFVLVVRDASPNGAVFGGYLTDAPRPGSHYYGTGECFLWRASVLPPPKLKPGLRPELGVGNGAGMGSEKKQQPVVSTGELVDVGDDDGIGGSGVNWPGLPPPPSADTTNMGRLTTLRGESSGSNGGNNGGDLLQSPVKEPGLLTPNGPNSASNRTQDNGNASASASASGRSTPEPIRFKAFPYSGVNDYMIFCETGFLSLGGGDGHYGLWLDSSLEKGVSAPAPTFGNEPLSDEGIKFDIVGVEVWYVGA